MDIRDALRLTGASLRSHKLRSLLAAIGVMLGIAAVIGVVTLGAGFQSLITGVIGSQIDSTTIIVAPQDKQQGGGGPNDPRAGGGVFTDRDLDAMAALPHIRNATASANIPGAEVRLGDNLLAGVTVTAFHGTRSVTLQTGHFPTASTEATVSNLTAMRLMALTNGSPVLGQTLEVTTLRATGNVTIVGIEKAQTVGFGGGESLSMGDALLQTTNVNGTATHVWALVTLHAKDTASVGDAKKEIKDYTETTSDARFRISDRQEFAYRTQEDIAKQITTSVNQFTAFIGAIGAISLLVGLVGIANIMLVSVQERTREIGVMKAIGAKRSEIVLLFLFDAIAICIVGAVLGILGGTLIGFGLDAFISAVSGGDAKVPFVFLGNWYAIAIGMGVGVGLIAGIYPAWRAANVSPVEALRYE